MVRKAEKVVICTGHFEMSMMSTVILVLLLHKLNASHVEESKRHTFFTSRWPKRCTLATK